MKEIGYFFIYKFGELGEFSKVMQTLTCTASRVRMANIVNTETTKQND